MFKINDTFKECSFIEETAEGAAYHMNFEWWFESKKDDSVLHDAIERDVNVLTAMKCGEKVRIGWHIIERTERATMPNYTIDNNGATFKVRHEVVYGEPRRGELSADRLRELVLIAVHGEWYALVEDTRYGEYVRLYEDGHMTQLQREDCVKLHIMGVM